MEVIGWPTNVNNRILIETTITTGEGGKVEDTSSNGFKETRATSLVTPKKYNVKMDFDWGGAGSEFQYPKDNYGLTEYDRFIRWYQFEHQKGAKPFWFPCITKQSIDVLNPTQKSGMALYKITSSLNEQQSGYSQSITMTWEEVYSGIINMPTQTLEMMSVAGKNGRIKCGFNVIPSTTPVLSDFVVGYEFNNGDRTPLVINTISQTNEFTSISFDKFITPGNYKVYVSYGKNTYYFTFTV